MVAAVRSAPSVSSGRRTAGGCVSVSCMRRARRERAASRLVDDVVDAAPGAEVGGRGGAAPRCQDRRGAARCRAFRSGSLGQGVVPASPDDEGVPGHAGPEPGQEAQDADARRAGVAAREPGEQAPGEPTARHDVERVPGPPRGEGTQKASHVGSMAGAASTPLPKVARMRAPPGAGAARPAGRRSRRSGGAWPAGAGTGVAGAPVRARAPRRTRA